PATITLTDQANNKGEANFEINIDASPPRLNLGPDNFVFSNSPSNILLPLADEGVGIDPSGTQVKISGISAEVVATTEGLILKPKAILKEGSYEVEVAGRDLIGNTGQSITFGLIIDETPPTLTLTTSVEEKTNLSKLTIQGSVYDQYLAGIKIYNHEKLLTSLLPKEQNFSAEISLFPGDNEIKIIAEDRAGNQAIRFLKTYAKIQNQAIISQWQNGPNPFSTTSLMYFTFQLLNPADLKIYIFDLAGTLIWKRELKGLSAGYHNEITWDGRDHFGKMVSNGVYPYFLQATSGNMTEIRKGKIIVLQ
ncbi:MAG: FlgD immunoglobulin-like domain containing protein, partial [Candidatus Margulisiibacteriota bacterium]